MTGIYKRLGPYELAVLDYDDFNVDGETCLGYQITRINVPRAYRGQGHARELMQRMLAKADAESLVLYLEIVPSDGLDYQQLAAWYKRVGFIPFGEVYRRLPVSGVHS